MRKISGDFDSTLLKNALQLLYFVLHLSSTGVPMSNTATLAVRVDRQLKQEAEEVFRTLGLSTSQAIKLFLT